MDSKSVNNNSTSDNNFCACLIWFIALILFILALVQIPILLRQEPDP